MKKRRSEEHTSELQSPDHLVCRLLLEKKKKAENTRAWIAFAVGGRRPTLRHADRKCCPCALPDSATDVRLHHAVLFFFFLNGGGPPGFPPFSPPPPSPV